MLTKDQTEELIRCYDNPVYFINNYFRLANQLIGTIPFSLYPIQEDFLQHLNGDEHLLALSSRQVGQTNVICAYALWSIIFEHKTIAIVGRRRSEVMIIMKIINDAYDSLPEFLQPHVTDKNKHSLAFDTGGKILTAVSTNEYALRGHTLHTVLVLDSSYLREFDIPRLLENVIPTLSYLNGKIVLASSGNVPNSDFDKMWNDPNSTFKKFLMPWDSVPNRDSQFKSLMISKLGEELWYREFEFIDNSK